MIFIDPKTDFAFKKIFGSEQTKDILISFLNALLYEGQPQIEDLEILDPYLPPPLVGMKDTYLDVKARLQDGTIVIIEMQVLNVESFERRVLFNAAKSYSLQLQKGQSYIDLKPVIALTIVDFVMFPQFEKAISSFCLREKELAIDYPTDRLELFFIELPKFAKELNDLETLSDKWIYFIKFARSLDDIPENMQTIPEFRHAFEVAKQANLTREEFDKFEAQEAFIRDTKGMISFGIREGVKEALEEAKQEILQQGVEQGIEQGLEQGREQGIEQGIERGKRQQAIEIARRLLGTANVQDIADITGLTLEEVAQLQTE